MILLCTQIQAIKVKAIALHAVKPFNTEPNPNSTICESLGILIVLENCSMMRRGTASSPHQDLRLRQGRAGCREHLSRRSSLAKSMNGISFMAHCLCDPRESLITLTSYSPREI